MSVAATAEFPRTFVAPGAAFDDWAKVEPYYQKLLDQPIADARAFEQWLMNWGELDSCFDEEATRRYTAMTCQTDDPAREQAYLHFIENVKPLREPIAHKLREKLVDAAAKFNLPKLRYEVLLRSARAELELFREENIPLLTEDEKLATQYQKICAAMMVTYRGQEMTLQQLAKFLEEPDRAVREESWRIAADRHLQDAPALDQLYDQMVRLRDRIARNANCADFQEYAFKSNQRFDYTPEDCYAFHDAIEKVVVPAARQIGHRHRKQLGLSTLRPWDHGVDPENRPPLRPFETDEQLANGCSRIFHRVNGDLGKVFDTLRERGVLDLGSRKGKAPGGYQATFKERRLPFIFMNAVGTERDVKTLLHEGGHAFHSWAYRNEPLAAYRNSPIEFAEVASMGMECLALPFTEEFYKQPADRDRSRKRFFEDIVLFFPWMARVDAFQHYVYTNVGHDPERRKDEWQKLTRRFDANTDWTGLETYDRHRWHRQLHFFEVPFYYVEYGIAQLGALQVWKNSREDYEQAVALYRNGLTLGGARPLPELFEAAGCKFDFSEKTLRPLIDAVMEEIDSK